MFRKFTHLMFSQFTHARLTADTPGTIGSLLIE